MTLRLEATYGQMGVRRLQPPIGHASDAATNVRSGISYVHTPQRRAPSIDLGRRGSRLTKMDAAYRQGIAHGSHATRPADRTTPKPAGGVTDQEKGVPSPLGLGSGAPQATQEEFRGPETPVPRTVLAARLATYPRRRPFSTSRVEAIYGETGVRPAESSRTLKLGALTPSDFDTRPTQAGASSAVTHTDQQRRQHKLAERDAGHRQASMRERKSEPPYAPP